MERTGRGRRADSAAVLAPVRAFARAFDARDRAGLRALLTGTLRVDYGVNAVSRSNKPPWATSTSGTTIIGTVVSAIKVGDVFFAAEPGEGYPPIFFELQQRVDAHHRFVFGLANDQLSYLISPQEGYDQIKAAAPENDNALFNVSPTIGDHVMCTLFKVSRNLGYTLPADPDKCAVWATEDNSLPF